MKATPYRSIGGPQVSAGRPRSGANGGDITRRHGGQREAESQHAVWPQHPGEVSG